MFADSDRVLPRATLEYLAVHKNHRRHGDALREVENHADADHKSSYPETSNKQHIETQEHTRV